MVQRTPLLSTAFCSALLLLAGCASVVTGSGSVAGPSGHPFGSTSASTPAGTSSAPSGSTVTKATLQSLVLTSADLPTGWQGTPNTSGSSNSATSDAAFAQCLGLSSVGKHSLDAVNGDDFNLGSATISSSATSFRTQAEVDADVTIFSNPKVAPCFETELKNQFKTSAPAGATVDKIIFTVDVKPAGYPSAVVALGHATVDVTVAGQTVGVYVDLAFVAGKRIETEVDFENVGSHVPAALQKTLITTVADRTAAA